MPRRIVLISIALILGVCSIPISDLVVSYASMSIEKPMPGVLVKYYRSIFTPQIFKIVIENTSGQRYPTTVSLFAWMPNGSIVELGEFFGRKGATSINPIKIVGFLKTWYGYLVAHENNPALIKPGIIIMGAIHTPLGVYGVVRSVPLDMIKILKGFTTEIRIVENMTKKNILIPINEVEKDIQKLESKLANRTGNGFNTSKSSLDWPPRFIWSDNCYCSAITCYCYAWKLDKVYAAEENKSVPLIIVFIHGNVHRLAGVMLKEYFRADEFEGVNIAFGAIAAMPLSSGEFELAGFTVELGGENHVWLDYTKYFFRDVDFSGSSLLAIGLYANLAFASYRLELCEVSGILCYDLNERANMTLASPVIRNNRIIPWSHVDLNPFDGVGVEEKVYRYVDLHWNVSSVREGLGGLDIDEFQVYEELHTNPLLSASIAVLPLLLSEVPETLPMIALISASVGVTKGVGQFTILECVIMTNAEYSSNTLIYAYYFYSPVKFGYEGKEYYLGTLYINAGVFGT